MTQYSDGKVKLSFRRSTSSTFSYKDSCSSIPSLERKFTKVPYVINLPFQPVKSQPRFSTSDILSSSIHSVDYTTSAPHPIYTSSQHEQRQEEKEPSPPTSPMIVLRTNELFQRALKRLCLVKSEIFLYIKSFCNWLSILCKSKSFFKNIKSFCFDLRSALIWF